ncbi:hypothetical protein [Streptomyces niveus]|uniref:hypothetical protein n=1 Tax=Streptomyces niveus TaxID=193462 RepID=UPI003675BC71
MRLTVTEQTAADQDIEWGYILRPRGIEVITVPHAEVGRVVAWDTDPRTRFSDHPGHWPSPATVPVVRPAPAADAALPRPVGAARARNEVRTEYVNWADDDDQFPDRAMASRLDTLQATGVGWCAGWSENPHPDVFRPTEALGGR